MIQRFLYSKDGPEKQKEITYNLYDRRGRGSGIDDLREFNLIAGNRGKTTVKYAVMYH